LSQIANGGGVNTSTDQVVAVRSGTTDNLVTLGSLASQSGTFSGTSSGTNTGDQTITLTGDVTGTGTGSFATAIGAGKVTNTMLAGSIDLTAKVTGILPAANGGTANGFTAFSGPASSAKTFTLPNQSDTIVTLNAVSAFTAQQYFAQQS